MKRVLLIPAWAVWIGLLSSCTKPDANAGDPVHSDPKHYKVEFENSHIRVIRVIIGPHEKTPMHAHPANVVITLTDNNERETQQDGRTTDSTGKSRSVGSGSAFTHAVENLSDSAMETIVVELKDPQ